MIIFGKETKTSYWEILDFTNENAYDTHYYKSKKDAINAMETLNHSSSSIHIVEFNDINKDSNAGRVFIH